MFCETWENDELLTKHSNSEHFTRLVPQIEALTNFCGATSINSHKRPTGIIIVCVLLVDCDVGSILALATLSTFLPYCLYMVIRYMLCQLV